MLSEEIRINLINALSGDEKCYKKFRNTCLSRSTRASEVDYLKTKKLYLEILALMETVTDVLSAVPELLIDLIDMNRFIYGTQDKNQVILMLLNKSWFYAIKTGELGPIQAMIYYHVHIKNVLTDEIIKAVLELEPDTDGSVEFLQGWIHELKNNAESDKLAMQSYQRAGLKNHARSKYRMGFLIDSLRGGDAIATSAKSRDELVLSLYDQAAAGGNSWIQYNFAINLMKKSKAATEPSLSLQLMDRAKKNLYLSAWQFNPRAFMALGELTQESEPAVSCMFFKLSILHCGYLLPLERINRMVMMRKLSEAQLTELGLNDHPYVTALLRLSHNQNAKLPYVRYLIEAARVAAGPGKKLELIEYAKTLYAEYKLESTAARFALLAAIFHLEAFLQVDVTMFVEWIKKAFSTLAQGIELHDHMAFYEQSILYKNNFCEQIKVVGHEEFGCDHKSHVGLRQGALQQAAKYGHLFAATELKEEAAKVEETVEFQRRFPSAKRKVVNVQNNDDDQDDDLQEAQAKIQRT